MRVALLLVVLVGCEKASGVETSSGSGSSTATATAAPVVVVPDASLATTPNDAAVIAKAPSDAAAPADASARPAPRGDRVSVQMSQEDMRAFADLLTSDSGKDLGSGDMAKRRPGADLDKMIEDVKGAGNQVAIGGGAGRGTRSDGASRVSTGAGPKIDGPSATGGGADATPTGRVTVASKDAFDESTLTPDAVVAKIVAAYMAGVKRCYKTYLKQDPSARGKVTLSFTVNETGRAVNPKANGFAKDVDTCLSGMMSGWRFPIPKDRDGESTDASFAIGLRMVPD